MDNFIVTLLPNVPPVYIPLKDQLYKTDADVLSDLTPQWSDATPGTTLSFTSSLYNLTVLPNWLNFGPASLDYTATGTATVPGIYDILMTACDEI